MAEGVAFFAKRIDNGRSEVWLGLDGKELTPHRMLATNEVLSITRRLCPPEALQAFHADYQKAIDRVVTLQVPNVEELAVEFRLKK